MPHTPYSPDVLASTAGPIPTASSAVPALRVLLAEDESFSRRRLLEALTRWGYEVSAVSDGGAALAELARPDGPRLAIIDWEMPGLSGVDVCRMIRSRADAPYTYILLLTGRDAQRDIVDGLASGADDYVRKPFEPEELRLRLRTGSRIIELQDQLLHVNAELEKRALYDSLTGVKNRGAILEMLETEMGRSARHRQALSLIMVDIDHFKRVNDTYGHHVGDVVLKEFCKRCAPRLRCYDALGRFGGEEFVIVVPQARLEGGILVAQRLQRALAAEPITTPLGRIAVTASFGVASTEQGPATAEALIGMADKALYVAKGRGRNRVHPEQRT